jgi:predicted DNA-binding WGR domain protein
MRRFELVGGGSSKFWEISRDDSDVTVRYGRIGGAGQSGVKSFPTVAAATAHVDRLVAEKVKKGYTEVGAPVAAPTVAAPVVPPAPPAGPVDVAAVDEDALSWPEDLARVRYPRRDVGEPVPFVPVSGAVERLAKLTATHRFTVLGSLGHQDTPREVREAGRAWIAGVPDAPPLGAAIAAVGIAGLVGPGSWASLRAVADAWIALRGLPFAAEAAAEALTLSGGCYTQYPVERMRPEAFYYGGHPVEALILVAARVRAALAVAPEDIHAEALARLAPLRAADLRLRAATSFLVPSEWEWVEADSEALAQAGFQDSWYGIYIALSARTSRQVERLTGDTVPYLVRESDARLVTLAEGLGADAPDIIARWYELRHTLAEYQRRLLRVLAVLPYDRAFGVLLERVERKYVEPALAEAMRRFPRRAMRLLAVDRRRAVEPLLRLHVAAHHDLVDGVADTLPPADAERLRAMARAAAALVTAAPDRLPPLLVDPPWTRPTRRAAGPMVAGLTCDEPPAVSWEPAERDTWGYRVPSARSDDEKWQGVVEALRRGVEVADNRALSLFERGPESMARPVLALWKPDNLWEAGPWLRHLANRFGVDALPVLVACARRRPLELAGVLMPFTAPDVAGLMAGWLGGGRAVRGVATAWFDRHPAAAARLLIPAALGRAGAARHAAERALRTVAVCRRVDVLAAAASYGTEALAGIEALLAVDPFDLLPAKMPVLPGWTDPGQHPPLMLRDGTTLPAESVRHVVMMLAISRTGDPYPGLGTVRQVCDPDSLAEFAWSLFHRWKGSDSGVKEAWAMEALALVGNDETVRRLAPLIRAWPAEGGHARAVAGLDVLAAIGTDVALMHLHGIAERVRFRGLREKASEKMDEVAAGLGLSVEQLGDRLVPTFGLDADGGLTLDYGPRAFRVGFDEGLKPFVVGGDGKRRTALPKPGVKDDPVRGPAAFARFAGLKKDVRTVAADQLRRLERAMVDRRRWSGADFRRYLVEHPLVWHLARRLVWARLDGDGAVRDAFRIAEDRTLADVHDDPLVLADTDDVGVVHPLLLGDAVPAWAEMFADYEILQPFAQLDREVYALAPEELAAGRLLRFAGDVVPTGRLLGLEHRGWRRGEPLDAGVQQYLERAVPGGTLVVDLDPGIAVGSVDLLGDEQTLGPIYIAGDSGPYHRPEKGLALTGLDAITASEIIRDLTEVTA